MRFKPHGICLAWFHDFGAVVGKGMGKGQEFVLHSDVVAHEKPLSRLEVAKQEVGLSGFHDAAEL